jgi:tetratricopeptide (TPR) repeat protein
VREEVSPDPDVAELYLQKAVELARKDLETHYATKNKGKEEGVIKDERLAFLEIEKDQALVEIQHRLARFYGRIGRDEQAATVWTRLWKLSEKENPRPHSSEKSSSSGLGSLFGGANVDRPLISQTDGIPYAKSAADCWMRMGEYEMAEEALAWTLSTLASSTTSSSSSDRIEEVGLLSTLGALYVRQAKFEYALSLFVKALQVVQDHRASQTDESTTTVDEKKRAALKEDNDMWYCREAILTQSIGETLYGAATRSPASSSSSSTTSTPTTPATTETKKSSSWKFWSSSPSSTSTSSTQSMAVPQQQQKSPEQVKKEEEALGWMQKALTMAKAKSGQHRDCDECAALGLNNLGLINEVSFTHRSKNSVLFFWFGYYFPHCCIFGETFNH